MSQASSSSPGDDKILDVHLAEYQRLREQIASRTDTQR